MTREVEPGEVQPTNEWVGPPSKFRVGGRSEKGPSPNSFLSNGRQNLGRGKPEGLRHRPF